MAVALILLDNGSFRGEKKVLTAALTWEVEDFYDELIAYVDCQQRRELD